MEIRDSSAVLLLAESWDGAELFNTNLRPRAGSGRKLVSRANCLLLATPLERSITSAFAILSQFDT
jgi:hypothetical protein